MRLTDLRVTVFTGSYAAAGNGAAANDFDITDALSKYQWVGDVTLHLVVARTGGASTLDVVLTASLDGTNYANLVAFTQIDAATGIEMKVIAPPGNKALYKTNIDLGSVSTYTVTVYASGKVLGPVLNA